MSGSWNEALEAAAKAIRKMADDAWNKYKCGHGHERADPHWQGVADGLEDAHEAILALREADQRGAAARELPAANSARCDEGNPNSAGTPSLLTSAQQPAQSAPHHPGEQVLSQKSTDEPLGSGKPARPGPDVVMVPRLAWEGFVSLVNVRLGKPTNRNKAPAEIVAMARAMLAAVKEE